MNTEKLNSWLTLLTNIGVLAGILFLGFEISQNTANMRVESYRNQSEGLIDMYATAVESEILFAALTKVGYSPTSCRVNPDLVAALSNEESLALTLWFRAHLVRLDSEVFQYNEGTLDEIYFQTLVLQALDNLVPWWEQFNPDLAVYAVSILDLHSYQGANCAN